VKAMWPYVVMEGFKNTINLYCAFDPKVLKIIPLPYDLNDGEVMLASLYITTEFDLFVAVDVKSQGKFELWICDLDAPRGFIEFHD